MLRALAIALFVSSVALVGCGPGGPVTVPVSGNVQVDGKPVEQGVIAFTPADGKGQSEELLISNGAYSGKVTAGAKRVAIRATKSFGKVKAYASDPNSPMVDDIRPLKLEDRATSLTFEVPAAGGTFDPPADLMSTK